MGWEDQWEDQRGEIEWLWEGGGAPCGVGGPIGGPMGGGIERPYGGRWRPLQFGRTNGRTSGARLSLVPCWLLPQVGGVPYDTQPPSGAQLPPGGELSPPDL